MSEPLVLLLGPLPQLVRDRLGAGFDTLHFDTASDAIHALADKAVRVRAVVELGVRLDDAVMQAFPKLELIANYGVGYDVVDIAAARRRGIVVTNTPDVLNHEVADTALGLLLMTIRQLSRAERFLRAGRWREGSFPLSPTTLRGRKVGIVGMGRIGEEIAHRLDPFGVEILYHARNRRSHLPYRYFDDLLQMAGAADTLIVIVPGGPETRHLINSDVLAALGPQGIVINIARGSVIDEIALIEALERGMILGAGLDVFEHEPEVPQALIALEQVVLLPHIGSASMPTRNAMGQLVVDNVTSWFDQARAVTPVPETRYGNE